MFSRSYMHTERHMFSRANMSATDVFSRVYHASCVFPRLSIDLCFTVLSCGFVFSAFSNGFVFPPVLFALIFGMFIRQFLFSLLKLLLMFLYYRWSMFFFLLQVTTLPLVPPLVQFLTKHPMVDKFDLSSLQSLSSGAAPLARDLETGVAKKLPSLVSVRQGLCLLFYDIELTQSCFFFIMITQIALLCLQLK